MLEGQGGNIGISVGDDGIVMIDSQFAPLTPKILAAIKSISDKPIKFLINTHWHHDHVGGNENIKNEGASIVAHDNVRKRMSVDQFDQYRNRTTKASPTKSTVSIEIREIQTDAFGCLSPGFFSAKIPIVSKCWYFVCMSDDRRRPGRQDEKKHKKT